MHDWRSRCVPPGQAVAVVRPGDHVFLGSACATPRTLIRALEAREDWPSDVELVHFLTDGAIPELGGEPYTRYHHRVFFVGTDVRGVAAQGKVDYIPVSIAQVWRLIEFGRLPLDVAFVQVAPPDGDGRCSLGVSVDITLAAARKARKIVAEVNPRMPRTLGDTFLTLEEIDVLVEVDTPVIEYLHPPVGE